MRSDLTYREALAQQDLVWNIAWSGLTEEICGVEVLPFTPLHFVRLSAVRSPFVCGGRQPNQADVDNFLWAVSPLFDPYSKWKKFRHWLRYFRAVRKLTLAELIAGVDEYLDETWQDSPPRQGNRNYKAYSSPVVSMIRTMCPAYNFRPQDVIHTPYKQLFQLLKPLSPSLGIPLTAPADSALLRERCRIRQRSNNR